MTKIDGCKDWCGTTDLNSIPGGDAVAWWYGVAGTYVCSPACARRGGSDVEEGWERIDTLGTLLVRVTPREPPSVRPTMVELRVLNGEGQDEGTVRFRVGTRITPTLLGMLVDLLSLADCTEDAPPHPPRVRGHLKCETCGEIVVTGPVAASDEWAAYELGLADPSHAKRAAHFEACEGARLVLSFVDEAPG